MALSVHKLVIVDTILGAELLQILSLTAQLIQIVDSLIIDFFFRHNFSVLKVDAAKVIFLCAGVKAENKTFTTFCHGFWILFADLRF